MQFTLILATAAAAYPQGKSTVGKPPAFAVAFLPRPSLRQLKATNHKLADDQLTARQRRIRKHNEQSEGISQFLTQDSWKRPMRKELAIVLVVTQDF